MVHVTRSSAKALVLLLAAAAIVAAVALVSTSSPAHAASTAPPAGTYDDMVNGVDVTTNGTAVTSFSADCRIAGQVFGIVEADDVSMPMSGSMMTFDTTATVDSPYEHPQADLHIDAQMSGGSLTGTVSSSSNSPIRCDTVQFTASPTPAT